MCIPKVLSSYPSGQFVPKISSSKFQWYKLPRDLSFRKKEEGKGSTNQKNLSHCGDPAVQNGFLSSHSQTNNKMFLRGCACLTLASKYLFATTETAATTTTTTTATTTATSTTTSTTTKGEEEAKPFTLSKKWIAVFRQVFQLVCLHLRHLLLLPSFATFADVVPI